jgi:hypothetical protein
MIITDYMRVNFETERFTARATMTPLPETAMAADATPEIAAWLPPGSNLNDQNPLPRLVLNFEELGIEESDLPMVAGRVAKVVEN